MPAFQFVLNKNSMGQTYNDSLDSLIFVCYYKNAVGGNFCSVLQHSSVKLYLLSPSVPSSDPVTVTTSKPKVEVHENTSTFISLQIISWMCLVI